MSIDWFTFSAQIFNFLLLVALLRRLLYGRIIDAMNQREQKIADRLQEANQRTAQADKKAQQYDEQMAQIDQQRDELLKQARHDALHEHQRLLEEARDEVKRHRQQWHQEYRRERDDLLSELRRQAGATGTEVARQILAQLADADLEEQMCEGFAAQIRDLGNEQREEISHHFGNGTATVFVRSAFDLSDKCRESMVATIRDAFRGDAKISFETSSEHICGVELDVGGYSFGWNVQQFLNDLEFEFDQRLQAAK